jgi:hypothetical protein
MDYRWNAINSFASKPYTCGYCSNSLSSEKGYLADLWNSNGTQSGQRAFIYICHFCGKPTFFDVDGKQTPGSIYGQEVLGIDDEKIKQLYEEARKCIGVGAPTSAILACRKLLMHVAVEKGAAPNLKFIEYVEYLSTKGYIPPDSKEWVDEIREKGNEATHEIVIMSDKDAKDLIQLTEMLLKIIYQFPAEIKSKRAAKADVAAAS